LFQNCAVPELEGKVLSLYPWGPEISNTNLNVEGASYLNVLLEITY